jgi:hypothetical protein
MRLGAGKCLMVAVNCILDEFDESKLPCTRKAIFLATGRMDRLPLIVGGIYADKDRQEAIVKGRAPSRRLRMGVSGDDLSERPQRVGRRTCLLREQAARSWRKLMFSEA